MTKEEVLGHLRVAKSVHTRLVQKAKILIDKIDIEEATLPIEPSESDFGKWFYNDGKILSGLSNNPLECMQNIENLHSTLHEMYKNIFDIYCGENKKSGFFSKILGSKKEINDEEISLALEHYEKMEIVSKDLFDEMSRLERRLVAISDEKIEALV